jgi:hypothetical protein
VVALILTHHTPGVATAIVAVLAVFRRAAPPLTHVLLSEEISTAKPVRGSVSATATGGTRVSLIAVFE